MYTLLFINEADGRLTGRAYDAFMSAYCLARLYNKVVYVSDKRQDFVTGFREGPVYGFDELMDATFPKQPAILPPSLYCRIVDFIRNPDGLRDIIDATGGKPDAIWLSGNGSACSLATQVSLHYHIPLIHADTLELAPTVNEIQLSYLKTQKTEKENRIACSSSIATDEICEYLIDIALETDSKPQVYIIGKYKGTKIDAIIEKYPGLTIVDHKSDRGRLKAIMASMVYIHPPHSSQLQGIAEALSCGTVVLTTTASDWVIPQSLCGAAKAGIDF
jgi:glycosyltransferase involved in cell wall biosynthesis